MTVIKIELREITFMLDGSTIYELHHILRNSNALIVHFSGTPKGSGAITFFPNDLKKAISNPHFALSCSTIQPGDYFGNDPLMPRRAIGTIGIILDLQGPNSLMAVCPHDAGTSEAREDRPIQLSDCENSMLNRLTEPSRAYNEWNLENYIVRGIFIIEPFQICITKSIEDVPGAEDLPDHMKNQTTVDISEIALDEVRREFPEQRIYTFVNGQIAEWHPRGGATCVSHDEIYR